MSSVPTVAGVQIGSSATAPVEETPGPWLAIGIAERWRLVAVLTLLLILSFIDRNILKLLIEPLRADLGVSDLQVSLLVGLSFSMLYSLSCLPFGFATDRVNRSRLLGAAVVCWSSMSALCGFAGTYWQLFMGRAGLGIGEAALQPAAASLIRDSFPPDRRARAFSIFSIGPLVGAALAMLAGGYLYALSESGAVAHVPVLGTLKPWQFSLVVPGLIGVLLAFLLLAVKEPPRPPLAATDRPTFRDLFRHMAQQRKFYVLLFAAPTVWSLAGSGWTAWMAAGMARTWSLSPGEIGKTAGLIALIATPVGLISLGFIMDALMRRGHRDSLLQVTILVQFLHMVPAMLIFVAPSLSMMWLAYGASMLITGTFQIAASSILTEATPSHLIGKAVALFSMTQNFLGLAIGPTIFALVSEGIFAGPHAIVHAMIACYALFITIATALIAWLMTERRRQRERGVGVLCTLE